MRDALWDGKPVPYGLDNAKCKMYNEELWVLRTAVCMRDGEPVPYIIDKR